jgi:hypothetical protein
MKPALYVLCSSEEARNAWQKRAGFHCDLEVILVHPAASAIGTIHDIAAQRDAPVLVCRDDVWIGLGMGAQVAALVEELDARYPNWGVCGNRGVRWDGQLVDFSKKIETAKVRAGLCAHPVTCLDDNLVLINPRVARGHAAKAPELAGPRSGILLSLECLANGSLMAVSSRLLALVREHEGPEIFPELETEARFREYYKAHFLNPSFTTPAGVLELSDAVELDHVFDPGREVKQADILELFDRALGGARRRPSLTICCRTQFQRPEMLDRAALSFAVCREYAALLSDLQIRLATDQSEEAAGPPLQRLQTVYPAARIECWHAAVREPRLSRIDLLRAAVERAETDYIWFIDDDDYAIPSALPALARCLMADAPVVVIAPAPRVIEEWETVADPAGGSRRMLAQATRVKGYEAPGIFEVLRGENRIHLCGMIFPVQLLKERLRNREALGEYAEDYFLLLLALTSPRVEVSVLEMELAAFSSRGLENTTAQQDRSVWHQSHATFLLELLNNEEGNSPFLWQQANAPAWDWGDS